jgi:hypothetical protein
VGGDGSQEGVVVEHRAPVAHDKHHAKRALSNPPLTAPDYSRIIRAMTQTLDLLMDQTSQLVKAHEDGLAAWRRVNGIDVDAASPAIAGMVPAVTSLFRVFETMDRAFQWQAQERTTDRAALADHADFIQKGISRYLGLVDATLKAVAGLPPDARPPLAALAELNRVREAADELAGIYESEAYFLRGGQGVSWEEARKMIGV